MKHSQMSNKHLTFTVKILEKTDDHDKYTEFIADNSNIYEGYRFW